MNRWAAFIFFFGIIFIRHLSLAQQESTGIIKKYSIKEGLSQGVVNSITQDDKGLMWFATEDGLNRFDGYSFKIFNYDTENTNRRTSDNFVQNVFKDSEGTIWVSSRRGLYRFDQSTEQLISYRYNFPVDKNNPAHINRNDVSYITEGKTRNLWVGWYGNGFASFNKKTEKFLSYDHQVLPSMSTEMTIAVFEDSHNLLWVGSQNNGVDVFKLKNGKAVDRQDELSVKKQLPSFYVKCFEEDHFGNVWIGTTKGLVAYSRRENRFHVFTSVKGLTNGEGIFSLHQDTYKNLWIGTQGEGLYKINLHDFDGRHFDKLVFEHVEVLDHYNISQHTIRSIFEDSDGNLWLGTHGDGVYMISSINRKFVKIQTKKMLKSAESYVRYNGLCNDDDGFLWVGTDGEGIYKLTTSGDIKEHYTADGRSGSITDNVVLSAFKDHDGNLWFGTYSHGLLLYNREKNSFTNFNHDLSDFSGSMGNQVRVIHEDARKNIWVGASRGGLCLVDRKEVLFKRHPAGKTINTLDVRSIAEDNDGGLWLGGYGDGVHYLNPETLEARRFFYESEENNPLKSNVIYALALDKKDNLWIGTGGGGLGVYNLLEKKLKRYSVKNGLSNNTVYAIQIDEDNKIWVSTNKGISRFDPETEQFYNYNSFDGLQEGQFNPGSSFYNLQQEYMCFGGSMGLNLFYPGQLTADPKMPAVMISGFQLFNKPVMIASNSERDYVPDKVISATEKITLNHNQSVFTFEFVALNYSYPEKNKYAYKLEGLDRDWNYVGNHRTATYRYLDAGNYVFKVKATSQENVWPDDYASVRLVILPPFWRTPLAYSLYLVAIGLVCYAIIATRKKQAKLRKRLRIEKAQRKRERQMVQEKLSFFTEVSHEFRTPLTLMIGPLEEILTREGNYTPLGKKLKMVYKNAHKLFNLINKLLDYRKVETGNMVLKVRENNIVAFVEEIRLTFKELAIRKDIQFNFYTEHPSILTWFDKEKLEMVLNNILSNSFKYIGKGNEVSITIKIQCDSEWGDSVWIKIKDNGLGIAKDKLRYIFDWFYQGDNSNPVGSGIGLALAKKLIYLHKGEIFVESKEGHGSVFSIKIPLGKEHFKPDEIVIDERNESLLLSENFALLNEDDSDEVLHKKGLKSVLIVEDDEEIRIFLRQYFERSYKIYEADHGKSALEIALEHCPDLILSDIMMPEMNGIDFCKEIKNNIRTSHIPVILLTAKTSFSHHKEGLEIGADAYISKPFSPDMLALTINNLLQSRENLKRFYRNLSIIGTSERKETASPDEKFLQRISDLLKVRLDKPEFNLHELCDELSMSRSLMYKKIKMLTGLSPVEYLRSLRLREAANLLKSQRYKVFEVVYMVGFSDLKYFRQCFIKEFGYPPSELIEKTHKL